MCQGILTISKPEVLRHQSCTIHVRHILPLMRYNFEIVVLNIIPQTANFFKCKIVNRYQICTKFQPAILLVTIYNNYTKSIVSKSGQIEPFDVEKICNTNKATHKRAALIQNFQIILLYYGLHLLQG